MKLCDFIEGNNGPILDAWEAFASRLAPARHMAHAGLRDHASGLLSAIVADLKQPQTREEQTAKSEGRRPRAAQDTYAELHGSDREISGFSVNDAIAEFRALRASILRLWADRDPTTPLSNDELIRFNEAIDQALAISIEQYSVDLTRYARLFQTMLAAPPDLSCIFGADGVLIYANASFARFHGLRHSAIIGKTLQEIDACNAAVLQERLREVRATKSISRGEVSCVVAAGDEVTYDYLFTPVFDDDGVVEAIVVIGHDVTERKQSAEKISKSANYDLLTGLTNRSLFRDRLEWELKRSERTGLSIALFFIDLDGFKEVNDRLGHDAGDLLLQQAARRIGSCVRSMDTVARIGGDEFTVILSPVDTIVPVDGLAQRILDELSKPFQILANHVKISASIGITLYPQDAATSESLIRNADQAMYVAKKSGRDRFNFFNEGMRDSVLARLKAIDTLRQALAHDQLVVYYQPIVDLGTGRTTKAEALVRWSHPQRGLVFPDDFISLAEEAGLIGEIDDWVFGVALEDARKWSRLTGAAFQISVNKSAMEFTSTTPTVNLSTYLATPELDRGLLCVEITEGVLLNHSTAVHEKLVMLQRAGIQLAIDDFGTGYASMAFLNKFKVDYLKIDRSFVQDVGANADCRIFAETIMVMAHKLGLRVVAEGVETVEQRDWLRAAGCDYAQGYLYSKPMPSRTFENALLPIR